MVRLGRRAGGRAGSGAPRELPQQHAAAAALAVGGVRQRAQHARRGSGVTAAAGLRWRSRRGGVVAQHLRQPQHALLQLRHRHVAEGGPQVGAAEGGVPGPAEGQAKGRAVGERQGQAEQVCSPVASPASPPLATLPARPPAAGRAVACRPHVAPSRIRPELARARLQRYPSRSSTPSQYLQCMVRPGSSTTLAALRASHTSVESAERRGGGARAEGQQRERAHKRWLAEPCSNSPAPLRFPCTSRASAGGALETPPVHPYHSPCTVSRRSQRNMPAVGWRHCASPVR